MFFETTDLNSALEKAADRAEKKGLHPAIAGVLPEEISGSMTDGNFTMVFVRRKNRTFIGVAKKCPRDDSRPEVGLAIACRRLVYNSCEAGF